MVGIQPNYAAQAAPEARDSAPALTGQEVPDDWEAPSPLTGAGVFGNIAAASDRVCGYVIDLRGNVGGNVWPMKAGLSPLLGETYLIGADLKHVMTKRSKHSFASPETASEFHAKHGGTLAKFDDALRESYLGMADDVSMIRKNRAERRKKMAEQKPG